MSDQVLRKRPGSNARQCRLAIVVASVVAMVSLWNLPCTWAELPFESEPIDYLKAPVDDPVSRLQQRIDCGEVHLEHSARQGYLAAVLKELKVPVSSQVLVFSKTSFQRNRISPRTPRAIYFNDDVYVGWVQGGEVLEFSGVDPKQGAVFHLLPQEQSDRPVFQRQTHDCLQCHASSKTSDVPGHLVRSVYPDAVGMPAFNAGTYTTSHRSPLKERWGGWYVTGTHGHQQHMGNVIIDNASHPEQLNTAAGANIVDLRDRFRTAAYLSPHSDIVALMVLEHQTQMQNLITRAGYDGRIALYYEAAMNQALNRPADYLSESTDRRLKAAAESLLPYLLFADEALLEEPIEGTSGFAQEFAAREPRDKQGRSLRDFDLRQRLFKYPCSYLIYSQAFDRLLPPVKDHFYRRLWEILTGQDQSAAFSHLTGDNRQAIMEILLATKSDLPSYWQTTRPVD